MNNKSDAYSNLSALSYTSGEAIAEISDRVDFRDQDIQYDADDSLLRIRIHSNRTSFSSSKTLEFLFKPDIASGTYTLDGSSTQVISVAYIENTKTGTFAYVAEAGSLELNVHPDNHFAATFEFKGCSSAGTTLAISGSFDVRIFLE